MDRKDLDEIFTAVKALSAVADRTGDGTRAKALEEVVGRLLDLVGPVPQERVAALLEVGGGDVRQLAGAGVLVKQGSGYEPRRLGEVLRVARRLRVLRAHVDRVRWWLEDRELLAELPPPGKFDVERHLAGLPSGRRRKLEDWLAGLPGLKPRQTAYRVTGTPERLCVVEVEGQQVVVAFPKKGAPTVLLVRKPTGRYDFVHRLARKDKAWGGRGEPRPDGSGEPGSWSEVAPVAERIRALLR